MKKLDKSLLDKLLMAQGMIRHDRLHLAESYVDSAIKELRDGVERNQQQHMVICPFCNMVIQDTGEDEYKCLNLRCPLADKQNIFDFSFHKSDFNQGI